MSTTKSLPFFIVLLALPLLSNAQVVVNEIMYDSPGADDDWVEIYNSGSAPVNIVTGSGSGSWRFVDSGSHVLSLVTGSNTIDQQGYAIITNDPVKFQSDWPEFSGILFKSSFSVTNTAATLSIKDGSGNITGQVSYSSGQGAKGDGNSLQKNGDSWIAAVPTPGTLNASVASVPADNSDSDNSDTQSDATQDSDVSKKQTSIIVNDNSPLSSHYSSIILTDPKSKQNFMVGAGRSRLAAVGTPLQFKANANTDYTRNVTFKWSFGDGSTAEGEVVHHVYNFPGEYVVILNANTLATDEAASRTTVKVIPAEIFISAVSSVGVEIVNNSKEEINLYGRTLVSGENIFVFPRDTIILPGQKIIFSKSLTGLNAHDTNEVSIQVIGDELDSLGSLSQATKERLTKESKIQILQNEISTINNKLYARKKTPIQATVAVESYSAGKLPEQSEQNAASPILAISTSSTSISTTTSRITWITKFKHFFGVK
ncbi:lamin tail domain-containing protein [Candidatus Parcubacteria bacterium]|nr:lamin tail domain-containing protein [Candidatus Parcubacteria bacterium]